MPFSWTRSTRKEGFGKWEDDREKARESERERESERVREWVCVSITSLKFVHAHKGREIRWFA